MPAGYSAPSERGAASEAINDAIEGARATIGRVSLSYGARSPAAEAGVRALEAALAAQDAVHRVFVELVNGEEAEAWYSSSGWEPDRIAQHRGARVVRLAEADATLDEKVPALGAAITALVDAARGDDGAISGPESGP